MGLRQSQFPIFNIFLSPLLLCEATQTVGKADRVAGVGELKLVVHEVLPGAQRAKLETLRLTVVPTLVRLLFSIVFYHYK